MKVIDMDIYTTRRKKKMNNTTKINDNINKLMNKIKKRQEDYTIADAERLAGNVLDALEWKKDAMPIPAVKVAKAFGMGVFEESGLDEGISGNIYIGGTTKEIYHVDKAIVVSETEEFFHQRFVIIHELAHYLFDYIGKPISENKDILFQEAYPKGGHESPKERRADRFAAELLAPASHFRERYIHAMDESGSNLFYTKRYLSKYFEIKESCVQRRIQEVIR